MKSPTSPLGLGPFVATTSTRFTCPSPVWSVIVRQCQPVGKRLREVRLPESRSTIPTRSLCCSGLAGMPTFSANNTPSWRLVKRKNDTPPSLASSRGETSRGQTQTVFSPPLGEEDRISSLTRGWSFIGPNGHSRWTMKACRFSDQPSIRSHIGPSGLDELRSIPRSKSTMT